MLCSVLRYALHFLVTVAVDKFLCRLVANGFYELVLNVVDKAIDRHSLESPRDADRLGDLGGAENEIRPLDRGVAVRVLLLLAVRAGGALLVGELHQAGDSGSCGVSEQRRNEGDLFHKREIDTRRNEETAVIYAVGVCRRSAELGRGCGERHVEGSLLGRSEGASHKGFSPRGAVFGGSENGIASKDGLLCASCVRILYGSRGNGAAGDTLEESLSLLECLVFGVESGKLGFKSAEIDVRGSLLKLSADLGFASADFVHSLNDFVHCDFSFFDFLFFRVRF